MDELNTPEFYKLAIFYVSYLYFLAAPVLLWLIFQWTDVRRSAAIVLLIALSGLAYARFIEPRILLTRQHEIELNGCFEQSGHVRIAFFSDTHNGLFGNAMSIERIARRVDAAKADFVLIAGDFVYFLQPDKFEETYAGLSEITATVFAVMGNHDLGIPGPDLSKSLVETLPELGGSFNR